MDALEHRNREIALMAQPDDFAERTPVGEVIQFGFDVDDKRCFAVRVKMESAGPGK